MNGDLSLFFTNICVLDSGWLFITAVAPLLLHQPKNVSFSVRTVFLPLSDTAHRAQRLKSKIDSGQATCWRRRQHVPGPTLRCASLPVALRSDSFRKIKNNWLLLVSIASAREISFRDFPTGSAGA